MDEQTTSPEVLSWWATVAMLAMLGLALIVVFIARLAFVRIARERERQRQAELNHQKALLSGSIRAQERERKRIAANLHDDLSSKLNVLKLQLHNLPAAEPESLRDALGLLNQTITTSRNISHELYPPLLREFGLVETIREFLEPLSRSYTLSFEVTGDAEAKRLQPDDELHLFRIVQELVSNIIKHAQATSVDVNLDFSDPQLALSIADNGNGFDTRESQRGLGIQNLESRVQILAGTLQLESSQGKGTQALIQIPWKPTSS